MEPEAPMGVPQSESESQHAMLQAQSPGPMTGGVGVYHEAPGGTVFMGPQGLRAGWCVALFIVLLAILEIAFGTVANLVLKNVVHAAQGGGLSPLVTIVGEGSAVLGLLAAAAIMALIEGRRLLDYNLTGPRPAFYFANGFVAGFVALSALVGGLAAGGWLHFGSMALSGSQIISYAVLWGVGFLLVGCMEEGMFRCYLQFTLARGINFWWALALNGAMVAYCVVREVLLHGKGNGMVGVYLMAALGLLPCLWLHVSEAPRSGFWQAAWVTSTLFGFVHTGNSGEHWIGIFAAAAIGFVFCVSIYVTGSAWWAIGCHAAWDWAETYFYGTADSGMVAKGHLLTTAPAGNPLWSGGTVGPEGSLLVLAVIGLLLLALIGIYGRRRGAGVAAPVAEQVAG